MFLPQAQAIEAGVDKTVHVLKLQKGECSQLRAVPPRSTQLALLIPKNNLVGPTLNVVMGTFN